ncbi:MAG: class I SAM-dependent methyltransferase [Ilumatobacteraceae bacterium]
MAQESQTFDIPIEVAEVYEQLFVPSIFAEWAPVILEAVDVEAASAAGKRLLDVGCGTGIVARTARQRYGSDVSVVGVDLNPAMLTVARRIAPEIDWRQGDAGRLPFPDDEFDVAVSQMAAMFFLDLRQAVAEMARVVRPGGLLAWVVPASLDEQPAYGPFVDVAVATSTSRPELLGGTYWKLGDRNALAAVLRR